MLTVSEALTAILGEVHPFATTRVSLAEALGLVIADDVISDVDSPPFDKALMDGFAVLAADVAEGRATLHVIEEVAAGRVPSQSVSSGDATRIMTGAPIPKGADAVVRLEETEFDGKSSTVRISTQPVSPGANLMQRGTTLKRGESVFRAGRVLRPQELGVLAEVGQHEVPARCRPRIAVLATGDELVPVCETPGPGQIRNSNEIMLAAQIRRAGAEPLPLGIARDERSHLRERIHTGLDCDMLLLSGGVSAGKLDLVPSELEAAGVRQIFHKVQVKPGKPIWFGILEPQENRSSRCYVFGLPGNPVSSLVCFELFARTAIRRLMGHPRPQPQPIRARLAETHIARGDRPTYHPAQLNWEAGGPVVRPVHWHGSSDLRATVDANAMALFPAGDQTFEAGETVEVIEWGSGVRDRGSGMGEEPTTPDP